MTATEVTRGEFDLLLAMVSANSSRIESVESQAARRLESIDVSGTRGVGVVQQQLVELSKDMAQLSARMDKHDQEHETEARDRRALRRWAVGAGIALLAAVEAPLGYLIAHLH